MTASPREILKRLFGRGHLQIEEYRALERALDGRDQLLADQAVATRRAIEGIPAISAGMTEILTLLRQARGLADAMAAPQESPLPDGLLRSLREIAEKAVAVYPPGVLPDYWNVSLSCHHDKPLGREALVWAGASATLSTAGDMRYGQINVGGKHAAFADVVAGEVITTFGPEAEAGHPSEASAPLSGASPPSPASRGAAS